MAVFYSPTCQGCREFEAALEAAQRKWGDRVRIERRHLNEQEAFRDLLAYEDHYRPQDDEIPQAFLGNQAMTGLENIIKGLDGAIAKELQNGSVTFDPVGASCATTESTQPPAQGILKRLQGFHVGAIILAGLLDGINPCAFTTIIFLLSVLAYRRKTRQELAVVGAGFTSAVFGTYLLLGFGLLEGVKVFSVQHGISVGLAYGVGLLAIALAIWSLADAVRYARSREVQAMTLGMPEVVKEKVRQVIRTGLSTRGLLAGSLAVGFLVALLESVCTGQVYLPTIMLVVRSPGLRLHALGYLLLYNLMFILPLLAVLAIAYFGVRSERLGQFLTGHLVVLKLALAVLFAGLGVLVLTTV